jgi:tetratricopeptide (TPR) repeat protein
MAVAREWLEHAPKPRALTGTDQWHVFLSYRSINRAWVLNLYDVLREMEYKVFLDQTALKPGDQLARGLQDALQNSQAGILIWSSATHDSEWVQREYQTLERLAAKRRDFQFVPVRLDRSELPLFVENRLFLDFADYPDGPNGGELLRLLHGIAGIPLSDDAARFATLQDDAARQAANKIGGAVETGNEKQLMQLFEKGGLPWRVSAALGCKAADGLVKLGRNDEALKVLEQLEAQFPKAIRPKQLRALALARRAAETKRAEDLDEAQAILSELRAAGERDPETLGIYARTWMDRYQIDDDLNSLRMSRGLYAEAFDGARDDYFTGINAASKSVLLGTPDDLKKADEYATRVLNIVGPKVWPGDYWKTATAAEALLIQRKYSQAADLYQKAIAISPRETGSHATSWTQARRLMAKLGPSAEDHALIKQAFGRVAEV